MRLQIDRFEDGGWVVVLPHPDGRKSFAVPRDFFPWEAAVGDVFEVGVEHVAGGAGSRTEENGPSSNGSVGDDR